MFILLILRWVSFIAFTEMFKINLCYLQIRIFCNSRMLNCVTCPQKANLISPLCNVKREICTSSGFSQKPIHISSLYYHVFTKYTSERKYLRARFRQHAKAIFSVNRELHHHLLLLLLVAAIPHPSSCFSLIPH